MLKKKRQNLIRFCKKLLPLILTISMIMMNLSAMTVKAETVNETDNSAFGVISYDTSVRITIPAINGAAGYKVYLSRNVYNDISSLTTDTGTCCVFNSNIYKPYAYVSDGDADVINANTISISPDTTYYFYLVTSDGSTDTLQSTFRTDTKVTADCYWTSTGHYDTSWYTADASEYTICTAEQLAGLAVLNNGLNGIAAVNFTGKTIKLAASLDMSSWLWTPIGTYSKPFNGNLLDGGIYNKDILVNSSVIMGLHTNKNIDYQGLFGYSFSKIQNIGTVDGFINGYNYEGGIEGYGSGDVLNCYNTCAVKSSNGENGGISGFCTGKISSCYNTGWIEGSFNTGGIAGSEGGIIEKCYNTGKVNGNQYVGGITGISRKFYNSYTNVSVSACSNMAAVTGIRVTGGIAGQIEEGTMGNCFNCGKIYGDEITGGITGASFNDIENCYNTGAVSGNDTVGGIDGYFKGSCLLNCYCAGMVTGSDNICKGGIIGRNVGDGNVSNCYYNKDIIAGIYGDYGSAVTTEELKTLAGALGDTFLPAPSQYAGGGVFSTENPVNGGYPVLKAFGYTGGADIDSQFEQESDTGCYLVKNAYQLDLLRNYTSSDKYFKLVNNIDISPEQYNQNGNWIGIGTSASSFGTTFDGGGFSISGLYINGSSDYQGLFCYNLGMIKNLSVTDAYVRGGSCIGGVAGFNISGTVSDCCCTGIITGSGYHTGGITGSTGSNIIDCCNMASVGGFYYTGGMAGNDRGSIEGCVNLGSVFGINVSSNTISNYTGGITGNSSGQILDNCTNNGNVTGCYSVGGITGYNNGSGVSGCMNTGKVAGDTFIGGIMGNNDSGVISCDRNTGTVETLSGTGSFIGGIIGANTTAELDECYNTGTVNEISKGNRVGGIVGSTYGNVSFCYNTGKINGVNEVGGISGNSENATEDGPDPSISACYNTGEVAGYSDIGGITGNNQKNTITDCYNTGSISGSYTTGAIAGLSISSIIRNSYYCGSNQGIGYEDTAVDETIPFVTLAAESIKSGGSTSITQQTDMDNASIWNGALGADFSVSYDYQPDPAGIAAVSDLTVNGGNSGTGRIICNMKITQNELDMIHGTGFTGTVKTISVPIFMPLTVTKATPSIAVSSGTATVGEAVTITAVISNGYKPTGTVTFMNNNVQIGTTDVITDGVARIIYTPASPKNLSITADYTGDNNNISTVSVPLTVPVNKKSPVLSVVEAAPVSPQFYPVSVKLSSTISNYYGTLSNVTISFYNGNTMLGEGITDENGVASYILVNPGAATYNIIAKYDGNADNNPASSGSGISYTVNKGTQAPLSISGVPESVTYGDTLFTLMPSGGSGSEDTYTYKSDNDNILSVDSSGTVTIRNAGEATITVTKAGDANYNPISKNIAITVGKRALDAVITPEDKQYDATSAATVKSISYNGIIGSDDVYITGGSISFTDKMVSPEKIAVASGYTLYGMRAANYTPGSITVRKAAIWPVILTVRNTSVKDKIYDGTATAEFSGTLDLNGVLNSDDVALKSGIPYFENQNYSSNATPVNVSVFYISGSDAANYILTQPEPVCAYILKKTLEVSTAPVTINCGQSIPPLSVDVTGFVPGESETNIAGFEKPDASPVYNNSTTTLVTSEPLKVVYSGGNATNNYEFSYSDTATLTIQSVLVKKGDYQVSGKYTTSENPVDWNISNFTIRPGNSYNLISEDGNTWATSLMVSNEGKNHSVTFKLRNSSDGTQTESKTIYYNLDKTVPTIFVTGNPSKPVKAARLTVSVTAGISGIKSIKVNGIDITYDYKSGYTVTKNGDYKFIVTNGAGITAEQVIRVSNIELPVIKQPDDSTSFSANGNMLPKTGSNSGNLLVILLASLGIGLAGFVMIKRAKKYR